MQTKTPATLDLHIESLSAELAEPLLEFLDSLDEEDREFFHPHGFCRKDVDDLCARQGQDEYRVLVEAGVVLAYGFLRGWEEGYETPSIGVAVRREVRRRLITTSTLEATGLRRKETLATAMMGSLHGVALAKGAKQVRARVHEDNSSSRGMCESLGYEFRGVDRGQALGFLDLQSWERRSR
jgi:L-amino acid N-acyltransferase YncA